MTPYWIKFRILELHEVTIAGGTKRRGGRRRVTRWSKWTSIMSAHLPSVALERYEAAKKQHPLSEVGVFMGRRRFTPELLRYRAEQEAQVAADRWEAGNG